MHKQDFSHTNKAKFFVILCFGFFTISVQALLFRDFLSIYEGTELAMGFFFFAWFLWIAVGAFAGKLLKKSSRFFKNHFELFLLLYIPAYILEYIIIQNTRVICGITPYELFPLFRMVPVSLFALAPVSFLTGLFFTMACTWMAQRKLSTEKKPESLPVASVYIAEVSGGCAGGVFVTLSLSAGMPQESVFLFTALLLCASVFIYRIIVFKEGKPVITGLLCGAVLLVLTGVIWNMAGGIWTNNIRRSKWSRLLPGENYQGSFSTSRGIYHFGEYKGMFTVISWGSVCESFPDPLYGSEIAALHLVQNPGARNILIIGQGALPVCREFLRFPRIQQVVWATPDPEYAYKLINILPPWFKQEINGLVVYRGDVQSLLSEESDIYDLVIIHLPDPVTLVLNKFFTREFYLDVKQHMTADSMLSVQTQGGENYLGGELVRVGASVFETLKDTFKDVVIKPGDQSWLLASDGEQLSGSLAVLYKRYEEFQQAENIYPVEGLDLLYQEDRAVFQKEKYDESVKETGKDFLINSANRPRAMLYSLLFSLKQAGNAILNPRITGFSVQYGLYIVIGGIILYCLFRGVYRFRSLKKKKKGALFSLKDIPYSRFDHLFLIFSAGLAGISVSEVLIFFYQLKFGSLYLHIGLISALFMLGLCIGGILIRRVLLFLKDEPWFFLPSVLGINLLLFGFIFLVNTTGHPIFYILLFFASGATAGCYIPIVAFRQKKEDIPAQQSGATIEFSDHLGATIGGLVTGVIFIPLTGAYATLVILCFLLGINLVLNLVSFFARGERKETDTHKGFIRLTGYCLTGICLFLVIVILLFNNILYATEVSPFSETAQILAKGNELEQKSVLVSGNREIPYYLVKGEAGEEDRYIFSTEHFAPGITGYSGPVLLAVLVSGSGELLDYTVMRSTETPVYLDYVSHILPQRLTGKNIFDPGLINQVDTVTGATMTSDAIIHSLSVAGTGFAQKVLEKGDDIQVTGTFHWSQVTGFIVLFFFIIALILRKFPLLWVRRVFLLAVIVLCGLVLNVQYSTDHLFRLGFRLTSISITILVAGIPLVSILFGNVYCGYLCPFGALQELIGDLRPAGLNTAPDKDKSYQFTRYLKYLLLFFLAIAAAATMNPSLFFFDPLIGFFRLYGGVVVVLFCLFILVLSFFYPRVWCRNLCPAGAFLSLVGQIKLFRFLVPRINPRYCDMGVQHHTDSDCICCDRCRITVYQKKVTKRTASGKGKIKERAFVFTVIILILMLAGGQFLPYAGKPAVKEPEIMSTERGGGKARDVDAGLIESLIEKGRLSDHEAEFYKKFELGKE